ncbi:MAG: Uma2 family endonuclease [Thermomicrobiales bacterium]
MSVTTRTFEQVALDDPDRQWELHHGELREKPSMSFRHNDVMMQLGVTLAQQLDRKQYHVRVNAGHVSRTTETYYIPDVFVFPVSAIGPGRDRHDVLEVYDQPLPLVVEIWSPSTGEYDVNTKLPEYQLRGDQEIWRVQPFQQVLDIWRRQPDGRYEQTTHHGGQIAVGSLPGVVIDLDTLFL